MTDGNFEVGLDADCEIEVIESLRLEHSLKIQLNVLFPIGVQRYILYALGVGVIVFIGSMLFAGSYGVTVNSLRFISICGFVMIATNVAEIVSKIDYPNKMLFKSSYPRLRRQNDVIIRLGSYDDLVLARCKSHLKYEMSGLVFRGGILMGSLTRIGLFPAIMLIYGTYYFKAQEIMSNDLVPWFMFLFVGMYILTLLVRSTVARIESMIFLIDEALRISECNTDS